MIATRDCRRSRWLSGIDSGRSGTRSIMHKLLDGIEQLRRRLDLRKMPRLLEELEPRAWNGCSERATVIGIGDAIRVAPEDERRLGHTVKPARQAGVVHRGAGVDREGRAVAGHRLQSRGWKLGRIDPELVGVVVAVLRDLPRSAGEEVDHRAAWDLDADSVDEYETVDASAIEQRHLGRNPSAHGVPDDHDVLQLER